MLSAGINVIDLKSIPSAVLRFNLARNPDDYSAGVYFRQERDDTTSTVITFFNGDALRINSELAKKIEKAYFKEAFRRVDFTQIGQISESHRIQECTDYKKSMEESFRKRLFACVDCRIAVDIMHGTACEVFPHLLNDLAIGNMIFNNYHDAHHLANFKSLYKRSVKDMGNIVRSLKLDAGFLIYPYGQRLDIVCDNGNVFGMKDALLIVLSLMDLEAAKEGRKSIFLPAWAPDIVKFDHLDIEYGKYADFKAEQLEQYDLIATVDGNFAFTEFSLYRDSMYAAVKILEMIIKQDVKLSDLVRKLEDFYYLQTQITCAQSLKGKMMRKFLEDAKGKRSSSIDGVKIWLDERDWILMIPDQYSDQLNLYIQAVNEERGQAIYHEYEEKIKSWSEE